MERNVYFRSECAYYMDGLCSCKVESTPWHRRRFVHRSWFTSVTLWLVMVLKNKNVILIVNPFIIFGMSLATSFVSVSRIPYLDLDQIYLACCLIVSTWYNFASHITSSTAFMWILRHIYFTCLLVSTWYNMASPESCHIIKHRLSVLWFISPCCIVNLFKP